MKPARALWPMESIGLTVACRMSTFRTCADLLELFFPVEDEVVPVGELVADEAPVDAERGS